MPYTARQLIANADVTAMRALIVEARASAAPGYMHVGDLDWRLYYGIRPYPMQQCVRLWHDATGRLSGFAILSGEGFEYQSRHDLRGSDLDEEIVRWGQRAIGAWRRSQGLEGRCVIELYEDDAPRRALLERRGIQGVVTGVCFSQRLYQPAAEPALPEGFTVRGMRGIEDAPGRATAHFEAFSPGSKMTTEAYAAFMTEAPLYRADLDSVVEAPDGTIAAYAMAWLDEATGVGEFEPVGCRPAFRQRGFARAVLLRGLRKMREAGMHTAIVMTNADNVAARALYPSAGFTEVNRTLTYDLTNVALPSPVSGSKDLRRKADARQSLHEDPSLRSG